MKILKHRTALPAAILFCLTLGALALLAGRGVTGAQSPTFRIGLVYLPANDLVYHKPSNTIFASVPASAGPRGNTITGINPATGEIVSSVFIGSDPGQLALSEDGQSLFVGLNGGAAIRRYHIAEQMAGAQFSIGRLPNTEPLYPDDLIVLPGQSETVVVSRKNSVSSNGSLVVFEEGTARPNTVGSGNGGFLLEPGDGRTFFAFENENSSGRRFLRLAVDGNGATITHTASNLSQFERDLKFSRGRLYTSSGKVLTADMLAVAGEIGNLEPNSLVAPDAALNRVFYLTGSAPILTLRAFDQNTFAPLGALDIPGVSGVAGSLIRWGGNGFAFRTLGGQIFLVQTLLAPSPEPIPAFSPTPVSPTPTPTPLITVRQIPLPSNDLIYDAASQRIYASVPSSAGLIGNSLTPIDPVTGAVAPPIFIGSEPGRLAAADDGQLIYVALDGAGSVRRFDPATGTPGQQFPLNTTLRVNDLKVLPGQPGSFAVVLHRESFSLAFESLTIYDDGMPRAKKITGSGPSFITFGGTAGELYGSGSDGLYKFSPAADGLTAQQPDRGFANVEIQFAKGLIYSSSGQVIDPETLTLRGRFGAAGLFLADPAANRVYFFGGLGATKTLSVFTLDTMTLVGTASLTLPSSGDLPSRLIRWGVNGLAFRTASQIYLLQTELVSSSSPVPAPLPVPELPVLPAKPVATMIRQLNLAANDLAYDPAGRVIYASVGAGGAERANSLTPILPETGTLRASIALGGEPEKLAISGDGQALYVAVRTPQPGVRRFDTATQTLSPAFTLGTSNGAALSARDLKVAPGNPNLLAVARSDERVAIYDNGVARPSLTQELIRMNVVEFGATASTLYGYNLNFNNGGLVRIAVSETGATVLSENSIGAFSGFNLQIKFLDGLLYSPHGQVVDPATRQRPGTFSLPVTESLQPFLLNDVASGYTFFLSIANVSGNAEVRIRVFDRRTYLLQQTIRVPGVRGAVSSFIRWGMNGLAFSTTERQVFLFNTSALAEAGLSAPPVSVPATSFAPGPLARDSIVAAFGANLAEGMQAATGLPLPATLAGARLNIIDDRFGDVALPLFFASPGQINFYLPSFITAGQRLLTFTGANGFVFTVPVTVANVAPGLFSANASGQGVAAAVALRVKADGSQSYEPVAEFNAAQNRFVARPIDLGPEGEQVFLVLFGSGLRFRTSLAAVSASIGGAASEVLYAGAQSGSLGLDQINLRMPRSLAGRGEVEIALSADGLAANLVKVSVR